MRLALCEVPAMLLQRVSSLVVAGNSDGLEAGCTPVRLPRLLYPGIYLYVYLLMNSARTYSLGFSSFAFSLVNSDLPDVLSREL